MEDEERSILVKLARSNGCLWVTKCLSIIQKHVFPKSMKSLFAVKLAKDLYYID